MLKDGQKTYLKSLDKERAEKVVHISPYDPASSSIAQKYIKKIKEILPGADVLFAGSAALKAAGQKDIDLFIYSSLGERAKILESLNKEFGYPAKNDHKWKFMEDDFEISMNVVAPEEKIRKEKIKYFEILRDNPSALSEYENLKWSLNGKSYLEYQTAKLLFMNKILKEYGYE